LASLWTAPGVTPGDSDAQPQAGRSVVTGSSAPFPRTPGRARPLRTPARSLARRGHGHGHGGPAGPGPGGTRTRRRGGPDSATVFGLGSRSGGAACASDGTPVPWISNGPGSTVGRASAAAAHHGKKNVEITRFITAPPRIPAGFRCSAHKTSY
jgi:hypothetical protein